MDATRYIMVIMLSAIAVTIHGDQPDVDFEAKLRNLIHSANKIHQHSYHDLKSTVPYNEIPMVNSLPLNLHRIQALPNSLKNDLFRKEQLIDGILALSKSFSIKITNDIWIKRENVHDLSAKFGKSTFLSKTTAKQPLVLPAIYIAQQHGTTITVFALPNKRTSDLANTHSDTLAIFYSHFMTQVFFPALLQSLDTQTRLRYQAVAKFAVDANHYFPSDKLTIYISPQDWPTIARNMQHHIPLFHEKLGYELFIGVYRMGQNLKYHQNYNEADFINILGLQAFYTERQIYYFMIHIAYCYYPTETRTHMGSIFSINVPNFKNKFQHSTGFHVYNTLGYNSLSGFTLKHNLKGGDRTIREIQDKYFKSDFLFNHIFQQTRATQHQQLYLRNIKLTYVQAYLGFTHAVFPRNYKPHFNGPASNMVLNGPTDEAIEKLHKDFLFWTNIIEEIENRQIALRVEFVIEIKTPPIIFTDTHAEITSALPEYPFFNLLFAYIRTTSNSQLKRLDNINVPTNLIEDNLQISFNFTSTLRKQISSLYLSMTCPLYEQLERTTREPKLPLTEEKLLTVHLAENLIMYLYDGSVEYYKDYALLHKVYQVQQREDLHLHNVRCEKNACGGLTKEYMISKPAMAILPVGYIPWLRDYKSPSSSQKFFIIRRLALSLDQMNMLDIPFCLLFVESAIVYIQKKKKPILNNIKAPVHQYLTKENYIKEQGQLPKATVTTTSVARYLMQPQIFDNAIETFTNHLRPKNIDKKILADFIETHVVSVLNYYVQHKWIEIFYKIDTCQQPTKKHNYVKQDYRERTHAIIRGNAADLFALKTSITRHQFSLPSFILSEILEDIFHTIELRLGAILQKQRIGQDLLKTTILPPISRIWYSDCDDGPSTYNEFLLYTAYFLSSWLHKQSTTELAPHKYIRITEAALKSFQRSNKIKLTFFAQVGLAHKSPTRQTIKLIDLTATTGPYQYWLGNTLILQNGKSKQSKELLQYYNWQNPRQNRFHFTPCDSSQININHKDKPMFNLEDIPHIPDTYFFIKSSPHSRAAPDFEHIFILRVSPQFKEFYWNLLDPQNKQPKFLPFYLEPKATSITSINLYEHNLEPARYTVTKNGQYIDKDNDIVFAQPISIHHTDFIQHEENDELFQANQLQLTQKQLTLLNCWHLERYADCDPSTHSLIQQPETRIVHNQNRENIESEDINLQTIISPFGEEILKPFTKQSTFEVDTKNDFNSPIPSKIRECFIPLQRITIKPSKRRGRPRKNIDQIKLMIEARRQNSEICIKTIHDQQTLITCNSKKLIFENIIMTRGRQARYNELQRTATTCPPPPQPLPTTAPPQTHDSDDDIDILQMKLDIDDYNPFMPQYNQPPTTAKKPDNSVVPNPSVATPSDITTTTKTTTTSSSHTIQFHNPFRRRPTPTLETTKEMYRSVHQKHSLSREKTKPIKKVTLDTTLKRKHIQDQCIITNTLLQCAGFDIFLDNDLNNMPQQSTYCPIQYKRRKISPDITQQINKDYQTIQIYPSFSNQHTNDINDYLFIPVPEDGSCLYNSISTILYGRTTDWSVKTLRQSLSSLVNYDQLTNGIHSPLTPSLLANKLWNTNTLSRKQFHNLEQEIIEPNAWGSEEVIMLLSYLLKQPVYVLYLQTSQTSMDWKTYDFSLRKHQHKIPVPRYHDLIMFGPPFLLCSIQRLENGHFFGYHFEPIIHTSYIIDTKARLAITTLRGTRSFTETMRHYRSIFEPTGQWNKDHDIKQGDESDLISVNIL